MTETWEAALQPWVGMGQTQDEYRARALEQEAAGRRLVTNTFYGAYPDGGDGLESWLFDVRVVTDYRTGQTLHVLDFEDEQPATEDFQNLLPMKLVLAEA